MAKAKAKARKKAPKRVGKKAPKRVGKKAPKRVGKKAPEREEKGPVRQPSAKRSGPKGSGVIADRFIRGKTLYQLEWVKCGSPKCKLEREGKYHGPYWYSYSVIDGRWRSKYIGKTKP